MTTIRSLKQIQTAVRRLAAEGKSIGLVPTMGYLHEGHQSLIRRAKKDADAVIVSIFVNPAQFGPREDLSRYPRDEKGDIKKITAAGGDIVFCPKVEDIYPPDFQTWVDVTELSKTLEGASRPGHFRGVTTIVAKLFNLTRPDLVVFGQKDYQQAAVLRRMTIDLGYPISFVVAPTVREKDGLAMSSRNAYFSPEQRPDALCLIRALKTARALVQSGETQAETIRKEMAAAIIATCPSAEIDYIAFTDFHSLEPIKTIRKDTIASLAVRVHGVRLIDNMKLA
jgi:pantoate--beta-alanine ligase